MTARLCPCESSQRYSECCALLHAGNAAPSAEALMRSRYTAFALGLAEYLKSSWHPSTRPATLELEPGTQWLGLSIKAHQLTGPDTAMVEFVARSRQGGAPAQRLHETSRFIRSDLHWFYLDGDVHSPG